MASSCSEAGLPSDLHSPHQCAQKMSGVCAGRPCPGITLPELTRPSFGVDHRRFTTVARMSSRFEERLRSGPPIVADGGMGALISGAVPRLRCPEEANLRAPESVVALHVELHPRRRRADRDEHVRRQPAQAGRALPRGRVRADQLAGGAAGARGARGVGRDVYIARLDRPDRRRRAFDRHEQSQLFAEQAQILEGRGVDLLMLETFFDLDELVAAIEAVRSVSSLPSSR